MASIRTAFAPLRAAVLTMFGPPFTARVCASIPVSVSVAGLVFAPFTAPFVTVAVPTASAFTAILALKITSARARGAPVPRKTVSTAPIFHVNLALAWMFARFAPPAQSEAV